MKLCKWAQIVQLVFQLIADLYRGRTYNSLLMRSCMSFLFGGQISIGKYILQFVYIFIIPFPVWAGINFHPAQTGNGIINMWSNMCPNFLLSLSVDNWPSRIFLTFKERETFHGEQTDKDTKVSIEIICN